MKYNTATLDNGLRIIHCPSTSSVVYCGYEIKAGTRDEHPDEEGLAHFVEHNTFKGTTHRRAWHILNCLESVGGDLNAFTNKEETVYYAAILRDHFSRAVDLLTDIVFHSQYPQTEIDKEVEVICDEIESYNDSPAELIFDEFENIVFKGHPLGHNILGRAEQLRTYDTAKAKAFTSRYYIPSNAIFFAYGDLDFKRMVRLLKRATPQAPRAGGCSSSPSGEENSTSPKVTSHPKGCELHPPVRGAWGVEIVVEKGTHQAHVVIGNRAYNVHDERRIALYLLNNMLGGPGMNARFNLSLRERNGLVYNVESSMTSYSDTGIWCVYFGCDPHDINRCRRLIMKELDRIMDKPLTTAQLNAAKKQIKGQIAVACDNRESFALDFGKSFLHYGWEKDITSLFAQIDALTPSQIQQVARETFAHDKLTTLIFK